MISTVATKKNDILNFFNDIKDESSKHGRNHVAAATRPPSLFRPTHSLEETKNMPWRDILNVRQHGLSYNLNKASESNEYLSLSVMERFIGAETASSYQNSPSSAKKRNTRLKKVKNRRKATPKRMTPGSKKKTRKTPSSSARKRLFRNDIVKPGPSRETSKRALFQSPAKHVQQRTTSLPKPPAMKPELANRVEKSKRALLLAP
ncbi:hypothetical protein DOY81_010906 [Sarcophaga bullata]|nr:hypothetical protein DOY81_010906 [Sarcophaga bullata]